MLTPLPVRRISRYWQCGQKVLYLSQSDPNGQSLWYESHPLGCKQMEWNSFQVVSGDTQFHLQPPIPPTSDSTPFLTSHLTTDSLPNPIIIQLRHLHPPLLWHYLHLHFPYFYILTPLCHCPLPWIIPNLSDLSTTPMFTLFPLFLL